MIHESLYELNSALRGAVTVSGGQVAVVDAARVRNELIDVLIRDAVFGSSDVRAQAKWLIWEIGQQMGARPASIHELYMARSRGEYTNVTVPAMNLRMMSYDMMRAALRHMMPRQRGAIVNNASVLAWRAQAGQAHYAAAKAGVLALTRCAAIEAAPAGVRVNAVSPSIAVHKHLVKVTSQDLLDRLTADEAFGRGAEPWEVANVIVFLATDYASYMTGETVSVSSQHP